MSWEAIFTGIGAILAGATGVALVVHEFRRRDRSAYNKEVEELSRSLHQCRKDFLAYRRWVYLLGEKAVEAGVEIEPLPEVEE